MTGRMVPVKHYDVVVAAARSLGARADGWRFVLVGEGSDRDRLMREARDLIEAGTVDFPEPGFEVLELVRDADVGVLMTNPALAREGLSNSIMEYMALGLPVVCGEGGGNPELVEDGVTGFIIPPADPAALAERLAYLHDHPGPLRMGAAGRERIARDFSVDAMVAHGRGVRAGDRRCQSRRVSDGPKSVCPRALRTAPNRPCSTLPAAPGLSFSPAI